MRTVSSTSYEAGLLEALTTDGFGLVDFGMTVSPQAAPDTPEAVTIDFEAGMPVRVNGKMLEPHEIVLALNDIGGRNGIGRTDIVENRLVGMKSRGVYEAPGMTLLYEAHRLVEQMTLDRDLVHLRDRLSPEVAEMVYYGFWYCAKRWTALMGFIRECQRPVTGSVALNLYKGNMLVKSRTSRHEPVRRGDRIDGGRRILQPDRRRGLPADSRAAAPGAGPRAAAARLRPSRGPHHNGKSHADRHQERGSSGTTAAGRMDRGLLCRRRRRVDGPVRGYRPGRFGGCCQHGRRCDLVAILDAAAGLCHADGDPCSTACLAVGRLTAGCSAVGTSISWGCLGTLVAAMTMVAAKAGTTTTADAATVAVVCGACGLALAQEPGAVRRGGGRGDRGGVARGR